jgi:hypothetical protein
VTFDVVKGLVLLDAKEFYVGRRLDRVLLRFGRSLDAEEGWTLILRVNRTKNQFGEQLNLNGELAVWTK